MHSARPQRLIGRLIAAAQWLALPLVVLLFLQWPLRDLVRGYSREANDLGQVIFALYVAFSITAATRAGTHLAADTLAQRYSPRTRHRLKQLGSAFALLPWALFVVFASKRFVMLSVLGLETVSGHQQSRLFHHQGGAVDHGHRDHRAGGRRYFPPAAAG